MFAICPYVVLCACIYSVWWNRIIANLCHRWHACVRTERRCHPFYAECAASASKSKAKFRQTQLNATAEWVVCRQITAPQVSDSCVADRSPPVPHYTAYLFILLFLLAFYLFLLFYSRFFFPPTSSIALSLSFCLQLAMSSTSIRSTNAHRITARNHSIKRKPENDVERRSSIERQKNKYNVEEGRYGFG